MTNLSKKKELAAKTLRVGKNRINFNSDNLSDIKEAITKQDIKELYDGGIITIKPIKGRKKIKKRKTKRGPGKIKKTVNKRKQVYVKITRKLRNYLKELKSFEAIDRELYIDLRKKIRMRNFRSKAHLKEFLESHNSVKIKPSELSKKSKPNKKKTEKKKSISDKKNSSEKQKKSKKEDIKSKPNKKK
tara:strand:- start:4120 stop:4683 length:564 start_codon:yes stop_codon:yes gene_type:complete